MRSSSCFSSIRRSWFESPCFHASSVHDLRVFFSQYPVEVLETKPFSSRKDHEQRMETSVGTLVCLITTLFATDFFEIKAVKDIKPALEKQLIISTIIMTIGIAIICWGALPLSFTIYNFGVQKVVKNWQLYLCVSVGLWAGLSLGSSLHIILAIDTAPCKMLLISVGQVLPPMFCLGLL